MVFEAKILQAAFARILRLKDGGFQSKYGCCVDRRGRDCGKDVIAGFIDDLVPSIRALCTNTLINKNKFAIFFMKTTF